MKLETAKRRSAGSSLALLLAMTVTQCRTSGADAPIHEERLSAAATATAPPVVDAGRHEEEALEVHAAEPSEPIASWDDPRAIAGLATRCTWTPWKNEDQKEDAVYFCQGVLWSQSCAYDPCDDKLQACKPGCAKSCESCDAPCNAACVPCEAACTDDACRLACATTAAHCKAACSSNRDRCVTSTCTAAYEACDARRHAAWKKSACRPVCGQLNACMEACFDATTLACRDRCRARFRSQCPGDLEQHCLAGKTWPGDEPEP